MLERTPQTSLESIQQILNTLKDKQPLEVLRQLFLETLLWEEANGARLNLSVGAPVNEGLTLHPLAQAAGLPVFLVEWKLEKLPGVTARRAVYRGLSNTYAEHLLCYVTPDQRQLAFVWAQRRPDGKTELRTLPYEVGSPARTTIEQLASLQFSLKELTQYPDGRPPITAVTDKL